MAKNKEKMDDLIIRDDLSSNVLGALMKGYKEDLYNHIKCEPIKVSTGSITFDSAVNITTGMTVLFNGPIESGKTSQCILLANNYLQTVPNSRGIYVKAESRLSPEIQKRSDAPFVFDAENWKTGTIMVLETNVAETVLQMLEALLKSCHEREEKLVIILDSLDGLILKRDLYEKELADGQKVAGIPLITKLFFKRLALPINKFSALLLLTSQASANIKIDPYSKEPPKIVNGSVGNSTFHYCDYIIQYNPRYQSDLICKNPDEKPDAQKNPIIGHMVSLIIKKSATNNSSTTLKLPIKRDKIKNGFWVSKEVGDAILAWELAKKNKNTFEFSENILNQAKEDGIEIKDKIVGLGNFYDYLEEDIKVCDWFYKKFKNLNES